MMNRDGFDSRVIDVLAKRTSFVCSNPDCRCLTIAASKVDEMKFLYIGVAAHITAASEKGPRFDETMAPDQRSSISNGIFLCSSCSVMIDKNNGIDFKVEQLISWKENHEIWARENLNKSPASSMVIVDGQHYAQGVENVIGLSIKGSAIIQPGTIVRAEGYSNVTGTKIG